MRLVATEYLSLDGVFEEPGHWSFPFFDNEAGQFKWAELQASDALLLGRKTYEGFAAAWPTMPGTGEFGEKTNSMTKYVVSSTLDKVEWTGSKLVKGDVASEMRKLKKEPGKQTPKRYRVVGSKSAKSAPTWETSTSRITRYRSITAGSGSTIRISRLLAACREKNFSNSIVAPSVPGRE